MTVFHRLLNGRSAVRVGALTALALALLVVACGDDGTPESTPSAIEVTDSSGVAVSLGGPAERIVSHSPGVTEILFAMGAGDAVVAVDEFSDYPEEAVALPKVTYMEPDPEQDLSFEPDLIIFATNQEQSIEQFRALDLPVFLMREPDDIEGLLESVSVVGRLTGREDAAQALRADLQGRLDAVTEAIEDVEEGPRVFFELDSTLFTVSPDSFVGAALTLLKAQNIAQDAQTAFPQLSAEAVVEANPEVILLADHDFGVTEESVAARPGWGELAAVRDGRIHPIDPDTSNRPGPRFVDAIEEMARLLYPDRFE